MTRLTSILVAADFILAFTAYFCAVFVNDLIFTDSNDYATYAHMNGLFFACTLLLSSSVSELYGKGHYKVGKGALARVIASLSIAMVIFVAIYILAPHIMVSKTAILLALLLFGTLQFLWHTYYPSLVTFHGMAQNVLVLGTGELAGQIETTLENKNHNYTLTGFVSTAKEPSVIDESLILGEIKDLVDITTRSNIKKIIIALAEQRGVMPVSELLKCRFSGIDIVDSSSFYEEMTGKVLVNNVHPGWFIYASGFEIDLIALYGKRILDIIFSALGALLSLPVMLVVALVVKLDSPGPVLFRQIRVGKNENIFELYKFRTMREDAESQTGAVWAMDNDPRVTKVGRFLRKARLDELPQFFNVLKGDMAFVGPRPERPEFVLELYQLLPYYAKRHALKPGVTGWAQVNYPYGASVEDALEKLKYDLYYIKNYSIFLDILIIMETVQVVLFGKGGR
ncbi:MAG TPA: TIGR03013 family XrtA/PEP-CTERM system glycosyltransferase [Geopsychrobacteraceae bacterium]|nr:TIGR03013 family XrtA/PEP-CTERM system glycosyltransferase [Geopsychrobacteraceae bacterium]